MKYRRRFEIIADILRVADQGSKKTRIMCLANLSHMLRPRAKILWRVQVESHKNIFLKDHAEETASCGE